MISITELEKNELLKIFESGVTLRADEKQELADLVEKMNKRKGDGEMQDKPPIRINFGAAMLVIFIVTVLIVGVFIVVNNMNSMFYECKALQELNISSFDTTNVENMNSMFQGCNVLPKLELKHFNTAKVTTMSYMFYNCNALTELDLSSFNTLEI